MSPLSLCFLLLFTAGPVLSEVCPDDAAISPCICDDNDFDYDIVISCSDGSRPEIERAFDNLRGKENLAVELQFLVLGWLPNNFFRDIHVQKLTVTSSELEGLAGIRGKPALLGLEDSLKELSVYRSFGKYKQLLQINLGHLRRLERLELGDNSIPQIGNDWFQNGPVSLVELVLTNNDIGVLGDKAFQSLRNLKYLALDRNELKSFQRSMLPRPASRLFSLDLSHNQLSDLPENMFAEMPSLEEVVLNRNSIHRLSSATWKPVWKQLNELLIEDNPLECDAQMDWMHKLAGPKGLRGQCEGPLGKKGLKLIDMIQ